MKAKRTRVLGWLWTVPFFVVILLGVGSAEAQTIGKTIDKSNYQEYKDLLFPAMLEAVKRGDFVLPTANLDFPYKLEDSFLRASEKNAGKFDVNEMGDLVEKSTGKIPMYNFYGMPFPKIDPKDPKIAVKRMWNIKFVRYRLMGYDRWTDNRWINPKGDERYMFGRDISLFFQGRPPGTEMKNPTGIAWANIYDVREPMSIKGTNTLAIDYMDERDFTIFNYIPAIRRVRQTSGVARSDPYMGMDFWTDCEGMWGGKNRSMTWKLVGERTILAPFTSPHKITVQEDADGTVHFQWPAVKVGYMEKSWKGPAWTPLSFTYVPRQVWIIEQFPKDPYYNWGIHHNYMDKETHQIWYKEVYDRSGQFRTWVTGANHYAEAPSGKNTVGTQSYFQATDERVRHSSTAFYIYHPAYPGLIYMPASRLGPEYLTLTNMLQLSK